MKKNEIFIFIFLLLFSLIIFVNSQIRVTDSRSDLKHQLQISATPMAPEMLKAFAGEFKGVVADYLLLEAASFIGANIKADEKQWDAVCRLLDQSSILDPYFQQTYIIAQGSIPWQTQKIQQAMTILERSKKHRTWDWRPGFLLGFNHFYFMKDNSKASQELMQASKIPGAPIGLATWGSRLASKAGEYQVAIEFLSAMYENTEGVSQKRMLKDRIDAVAGAYQLQQAVERFKDRYDRVPDTLEELLGSSILPELPRNPYNRSYVLKDGNIEF
ncbi:MAG: hypothetical protein VR64_24185 [Desulfatitalea sp. BRH_c12]|nr:MAG: hypothetical protein VR64_24185 [Desulfatitalea sp. BRH_c12]